MVRDASRAIHLLHADFGRVQPVVDPPLPVLSRRKSICVFRRVGPSICNRSRHRTLLLPPRSSRQVPPTGFQCAVASRPPFLLKPSVSCELAIKKVGLCETVTTNRPPHFKRAAPMREFHIRGGGTHGRPNEHDNIGSTFQKTPDPGASTIQVTQLVFKPCTSTPSRIATT